MTVAAGRRHGVRMATAPHAHRLFLAAGVVGIAHALPSLYWASGGTALVSTLGDWAGRWQRESPGEVAVVLSLVFVVKLAGAAVPLINQCGLLPAPALWRGLSWCGAAVLVAYGTINVVVAIAALTGLIGSAEAIDTAGLVGHAFVWDPLFALWGLLLGAALRSSRPRRLDPKVSGQCGQARPVEAAQRHRAARDGQQE